MKVPSYHDGVHTVEVEAFFGPLGSGDITVADDGNVHAWVLFHLADKCPVSVSETLYDTFILRELDTLDDEFKESVLVGQVLGKNPLGIGDGWIALRAILQQ